MGIEIQWGLRPVPEEAIAAWGARGILERFQLDLPWDRQDFQGGILSKEEQNQFVKWINESALPKLREHIAVQKWRNDSTERFEFADGSRHMTANCNGSHGYCYILCWQENMAQPQA